MFVENGFRVLGHDPAWGGGTYLVLFGVER